MPERDFYLVYDAADAAAQAFIHIKKIAIRSHADCQIWNLWIASKCCYCCYRSKWMESSELWNRAFKQKEQTENWFATGACIFGNNFVFSRVPARWINFQFDPNFKNLQIFRIPIIISNLLFRLKQFVIFVFCCFRRGVIIYANLFLYMIFCYVCLMKTSCISRQRKPEYNMINVRQKFRHLFIYWIISSATCVWPARFAQQVKILPQKNSVPLSNRMIHHCLDWQMPGKFHSPQH